MKRMIDRSFSETDLREMLESATGFDEGKTGGRFEIHCIRDDEPWLIVVEPDELDKVLVVVTAYIQESN